jgi:hypothetical protein
MVTARGKIPTAARTGQAGLTARVGEQSGQVLVYLLLAFVPLLGMAGFAIDIGHAYFTQRALQSQADAAALAAAGALPDTVAANALAVQYSGGAGSKNQSGGVPNVNTVVSFKCAFPSTLCVTPSAVAVAAHATSGTVFAGVLGIHTINVGARATACLGGWNAAYLIADTNGSCVVQPGPCNLGYPSGSGRSSVVFNESQVLRAFTTITTGNNRTISAWYNDEHALTLGVRRVIVKTSSGTTTTDYPISALGSDPGSATNPSVGTTAASGDQAGTDLSDRPMYPALFVTDITANPNSTAGDWQNYGTAVPPTAVYGSWKGAVRTIDKTKTPNVISVTPDGDPARNNWNLASNDPVPAGLLDEGFGAEASWNISKLGLKAGDVYRFEFMVQDGDQRRVGGDPGEGCLAAVWPG